MPSGATAGGATAGCATAGVDSGLALVTGTAAVAGVLAGVSVLASGDARHAAASRVRRVTSAGSRRRPGNTSFAGSVAVSIALGVPVLAIADRLLGGAPVLAGISLALLLGLQRHSSARATARRRQREVASALPRFADLVSACLEAGAAPADAVDAVRRHLHGALADRLAPIAGALRSGVDPVSVYDDHGRDDPVRGLVTALARAMDTGAPLADTVAAVADDQRRRRRSSADVAARRAGVHVIGPLVICFLPAFVLLGVVPVVLGIAKQVLGDLS